MSNDDDEGRIRTMNRHTDVSGANVPMTMSLGALHHADIGRAGGKAAGLGEMLQARLPVPPGFCVTTDAYRLFMQEAGLGRQLDALLAGIVRSGLAELEPVARAIQELFVDAAMPIAIAAAIGQAYADLGEPAVAVRSSATAEDLAEASFAGQQETFLNVLGVPDLLRAVQRCWASLWTARALHYRQQHGIDDRTVAMAVVVQTLVPAEIAGVLFTANLLSGNRQELVINASFGLGETVVAGMVTPDTYILNRSTLGSIRADIGTKEIMVVPRSGGGTAPIPVPGERRLRSVLPDNRLRELAMLGRRVEAYAGGIPQDIEWAVGDGKCWLLQARPITGLPPQELSWEPPTPGSTWIRRQVAENLPAPLSPLFAELYVGQGLERSLDAMMTFLRMPWFQLDDIAERPFFTTINGYAYQRANFKWSWKIVPPIVRATAASWRVMIREAIPHWRDQALPAYLATIERWKQSDPAVLSDADLLAGVRDLAWADAAYWYACALVMANAKWSDQLLDRYLDLALPARHLTSGLFLRGFPSRTLAAEADLEALAAQVGASGQLCALVVDTPAEQLIDVLARVPGGRAVLDGFQEYLGEYGHQIYNLDFAEPTQGEDPWPVLLSFKAMVQRGGTPVRAQQIELARNRDALISELVRSLDPIRGRMFQFLLRWALHFGPSREQALFYMGTAWPTLRRLARELGTRLVEATMLAAPDDIFYLESAEIEAALAWRSQGTGRIDLTRLVVQRRRWREAQRQLHPPPAVPPDSRLKLGPLDLSAWETQQRNREDAAELRGFAVSPGRVTAPASVIHSPDDFARMEPGTILVCPTTTPAWTPLFAHAHGLVTDVGGILAHGSIFAREYGIPAVMGTGSATERIAQGQIVTVDGDHGLVMVAEAVPRKTLRHYRVGSRRTLMLVGAAGLLLLAHGLWRQRWASRA